MRLLITPLAAHDLEEIGDYIARDNPLHAARFIAELRAQCEKICLNPAGYRRRSELSDSLRSCAHGNYVIFFESTADQVTRRSRPSWRARHSASLQSIVASVFGRSS